MSTYAIIIERADDGGYGAWSPDLPGCVALGDTEEEALSEMKEAMRGHLEVMRERGETVPNHRRSAQRPSTRRESSLLCPNSVGRALVCSVGYRVLYGVSDRRRGLG